MIAVWGSLVNLLHQHEQGIRSLKNKHSVTEVAVGTCEVPIIDVFGVTENMVDVRNCSKIGTDEL